MTFVEKIRANGEPVLVVDSGNLFFDTRTGTDSKQVLAIARLISRAYKRMGVAAINVGDRDLLSGIDFLRQEASNGLPLISANLIDPSSKAPFFPPYIIKKVGNFKVAFLGLLSPDLEPAVQKTAVGKFLVTDPVETTQKIMKNLRGQADLIVLLSGLGLDREREVIRALGIHFVLGGDEGRLSLSPITEGRSFVLQSFHKGMYIGKLQLTVENHTSPFQDEGQKERIKRQLNELDARLHALKQTRNIQQKQNLERITQEINEQKAQLQRDLRCSGASYSGGNRFLWTMIPLDASFTEDSEVAEWIRQAGIKEK